MALNPNAPFENDEHVIGRWEFVATVDRKERFKPDKEYDNETSYEELYFLPDGEEYWGFSWTKGYIKILFGDGLFVPYELDEVDGQTFMFVEYPSYGGVWVLKQADNERYTVASIATKDDVDLPFIDDPKIHGSWASIDYVRQIEHFDPLRLSGQGLGMKAVEFLPDGVLEWTWQNKDTHRWTKGTGLITWRHNGEITHTTAPAYEIRVINDVEYLFFEHKSDDYTWGRMKPGYYVMKRGAPESQPDNRFHMPFENDEKMVGRWEMVANVDKDSFIPGKKYELDFLKEIYFLPNGQWYWGFAWTKGYIKTSWSGGNVLCPYTLEEINGERYIFAEYKNNATGYERKWVLRQTDNKSYTSFEIVQWADINLPFVDDPTVHGKWKVMGYTNKIELFDIENKDNDPSIWWVQGLEFLPDGRARKRHKHQERPSTPRWTKGKLLEHFDEGTIAPAYEIHTIKGSDYLFLEYKNGDYVWGKSTPSYFVFQRENSE